MKNRTEVSEVSTISVDYSSPLPRSSTRVAGEIPSIDPSPSNGDRGDLQVTVPTLDPRFP